MSARWSIGARIITAAVLPVLVLAIVLTAYYATAQYASLDEAHVARGRALARQVAAASEYAVFSGDRAALQRFATATLAEEGVLGVAVVDRDGTVLALNRIDAHPQAESLGRGNAGEELADGRMHRIIAPIVAGSVELDDPLSRIAMSGRNPQPFPDTLGRVIVDLSRQPVLDRRAELQRNGAIVVGLALIGALALAIAMSRSVSRPIREVAATVERIGQGRFTERVPILGGGSIQTLAEGVNRMAAELAASHAELSERVEAATAELRARKDEAEMANIAKTRFLAAASHDLRQPMHALGLFIAALAEQNLDPRANHLIEQIGASASAMEDLLDSLLDISRLDAGVLEPRRQPVALQMLFDRIRTNMQRDASDRNVKLFIRRTEAWVESDPVLLERIVANLVSNAVRYAPDGRVLVCARADQGRVRIEVRDNGIGIPRESQAVIFQEFVQLGNPERSRGKGLGLGLAIVSRLTALLGHQLNVRSAPGRGSVFAVTLPAASSAPPVEPVADRTPGDLAGTHVVIIDDDPLALTSLEVLLRSWDCAVTSGTDLAAVVGALDTGTRPPQVVLSDLRLGSEVGGVSTIAALRSRYGRNIPAALVSGDTLPEALRMAQDAGLPLLNKPLRPAKLRAFLMRCSAPFE